jgi:beta-lactamase regulating signal transducer with metallopeptidase domain
VTVPTTLDTLATIVFTYAVHSAAACLLALALARVLRRPQDRDLVWKSALIAPLLTTAVAATTLTTGAQLDLSMWARHATNFQLPSRTVMIRVVQDASGESVTRSVNDPVTVTIALGAVAIAALCISIAAVRVSSRYRRRGLLLAGRQAIETADNIHISIAHNLPSPVALGSDEVCLPAEVATAFSDEHRRALIAHERAHLARRDPAWFAAVEVIGALSAFQPLMSPLIRAFRRDVELICDEAAVRQTNDPRALIGALARLASPFDARSPLLGTALAYDGSPLVARAERIAAVACVEETRGIRAPAIILAAGLVATLFAVPTIASSPRDVDLPLDPFALHGAPHIKTRFVEMNRVVTNGPRRIVVRYQ